jgi:glycosyltransferase involved in cell wall biosynthesis
MRLLIDASVFQLSVTGVARAVGGLYQACRGLMPGLELWGLHQGALSAPLPEGMRDLPWGGRLPGRVWRPLAFRWHGLRLRPGVAHFPWNREVVRPTRDCVTVLTLHDLIPLALPELYFSGPREEDRFRKRARREVAKADLVLTDSECSKRDIMRHLEPEREPVVVPLAVNLADAGGVQADFGLPEPYYFYYGGYERRKGLEPLVRVFRRLFADRMVSGPLVLAGDPVVFSSEFGRELAEARSTGAVRELGYVADHDLVRLVRGARALLYPSKYEGFGYPPLEAMALGCPVLTTRAGSIPEVCGDAARYVEAGAEDELAAGIMALERDRDLREELRARGKERAKLFTWERSARIYLAALGRLQPGLSPRSAKEDGDGGSGAGD